MSNLLFPLENYIEEIATEFKRIMAHEAELHDWVDYTPPNPDYFYRVAALTAEVSRNATVLRSYNNFYHLTDAKIAYESDAGHTLLASWLMLCYLSYVQKVSYTNEFLFSFFFAMLIHDLPENIIGDIPDDGGHDRLDKPRIELLYWSDLLELLPKDRQNLAPYILSVLTGMSSANTVEREFCYLADKVSAPIATLTLDCLAKFAHDHPDTVNQNYLDISPRKHFTDPNVSERDFSEMAICDYDAGGYYKASEMWTIDFLHARKIADHDHSGFFTALLVMYTLMINGGWYNWRQKDYDKFNSN